MKNKNESGIALIMALLILVLMGALLHVFIVKVNSTQNTIGMDIRSRKTFDAAYAALERMSQFMADAVVDGIINDATIGQMEAAAKDMTINDKDGNKITISKPKITKGTEYAGIVQTGSARGLEAYITDFTITLTARSHTGEEIKLERVVRTFYIPVFQFGVFSDASLEFSSGANFDFGGRVHTNGNLHLLSGNEIYQDATLTLADYVSAAGRIFRKSRMNTRPFNDKTGPVRIIKTNPVNHTDNDFRALDIEEGNDDARYKNNDERWKDEVYPEYNGYLSNGYTGTEKMELPISGGDLQNEMIIRRPPQNEDPTSKNSDQRYFSTAGLRILLSDTPGDITGLPHIDKSKSPVPLETKGVYKFAESSNPADFKKRGANATGAPLIGGYIKIEIRKPGLSASWTDVTDEILSSGYTGASMDGNCTGDLSAIIRVQRFKDGLSAPCTSSPANLWPNVLFDTREGTVYNDGPEADGTRLYLGGIMHYIELDIARLSKWMSANDYRIHREDTGYVVYFSDRRGSRNEDARYLYESSGHDTDGDGKSEEGKNAWPPPEPSLKVTKSTTVDEYVLNIQTNTGGNSSPVNNGTTPVDTIDREIAKRIPPIFFRRAVKLVNGGKIALGVNSDTKIPYGLTIASENPVYIQGNYNANADVFSGVAPGKCTGACVFNKDNHSVPAAIIADAVTLLSNSWADSESFSAPYNVFPFDFFEAPNNEGGRMATTTYYRTAIIMGKNKAFKFEHKCKITIDDCGDEWGSDGGVSNFLRMLELWTGSEMFYDGSFVSLYYAQQANSAFKFRSTVPPPVYSAPDRKFYFDSEFSNLNKLPPRTPMFRTIEVLSSRRVTGNR